MVELIDINEGKTGANGLPAALVGGLGVALLTVNIWISVLCFVLCVLMASVTEGVAFDVTNKKYRKYYALFNWKSGSWKDLPQATQVDLKLHIRSFSVTKWLPKSPKDTGRARERVLTYTISFENSGAVFYEFNKYVHARKALEALSEILQVPMQDYIEEQLNT